MSERVPAEGFPPGEYLKDELEKLKKTPEAAWRRIREELEDQNGTDADDE